ncbi:MAG: MFS transporter [Eggerthellaceae bacterium]|jgi:MFS family permease
MKQHYEKIITLCCFLLMFCNVGLPSTSFSVYQPYIVALPGIGDSAGSIIIGVRTFVSLICMIFVGRFYARLDCRLGCFIAALCTGTGLLLFGWASTFPGFCLAAAVCGMGYGLGGMIGCTLLINRWFKTDVGTAVGVAAVGSGVANIIIPLAAEQIINAISLSVSFWLEGLLAYAIGAVAFLLLRNRPADIGLKPYINPQAKAAYEAEKKAQKPVKVDTGVSLPKPAFRVFFFAMMLVGAICVAAPTFISVLLVSEGFDHTFAAAMISVTGISLTVSKFCTGRLFDKLGAIRGTIISLGTFTVGLALLCVAASGNVAVAVIGIICYGAGVAVGSVGIPVWSLHLSTPEERGDIVRQFQVGYATGSFLFNLVPGVLMDVAGSYVISYAIMTAMSLTAMFIVVSIYSRYHEGKVRKSGPQPS